MFSIYLTWCVTEGSAHPKRVADVTRVDGASQAQEICVAIQPYLRDGVEAHFTIDGPAEGEPR